MVGAGPHFFVDPADVDLDARPAPRAVVRGHEAAHLAVVLRAQPGAAVSLADGRGRVYAGRVARAARDEVIVQVDAGRDVPPPRPRLTVVHGLPKRRKLDEVVQRLTELGVDRLVPVTTERSEVRLDGERAARAVARWRAVALAAAKQSRRARLLEVAEVGRWAAAFQPGTRGAVLWEEAAISLRAVLDPDADELVLGVGPEGGLTAAEVAAAGLPAASLGPTVLRTETAALVAATAVLTLTGRLA
jgi:16S rRNA (uracil1498-N3)-methyltransferase